MASTDTAWENPSPQETTRHETTDIQEDNTKLLVRWGDQHRSTFHYIWLRDNCTCPACGDPVRGEKRIRIVDIPTTVKPQSVQLDKTNQINVVWQSDGHRSRYESQWLRRHCNSVSERQRRRQPVLWNSDIARNLPEIDHETVLTNSAGRLQLLEHLRDYGICFVRNVPPRPGELESFSSSFGPMVETEVGKVFEIVVQPEDMSKSVANLTRELMPHTDDSYRETFPGIVFFHCLSGAEDRSGQSIFVDGFQIAEVLRQQTPEAFDLLTRYPVPFRKHAGDAVDMEARRPLINAEYDGRVTGICINNLFAAPLDLPEAIVEPYYRAYRKLMQIYTDRKYWLTAGLRSGDLVLFDNHRLLHGRTAISSQNLCRHIRYCSVARDYLYSQLRRLARPLSVKAMKADE